MAAMLMGWKPSGKNGDDIVDVEQLPVARFESLRLSSSGRTRSSSLDFGSSGPSLHQGDPTYSAAQSPSATSSSTDSLYPLHDSFFPYTSAPSSDRRAQRNRLRNPEWVPRPRNAFIIFRCRYSREHSTSQLKSDGSRIPNTHTEKTLSKRAAEAWKRLPDEEKDLYKRLAEDEKEDHARLHPHYRFKPTKRRTPIRRRHTIVSPAMSDDFQGSRSRESTPDPSCSPFISRAAHVIRKRRSFSVPLPGDSPMSYARPPASLAAAYMPEHRGLRLKRSMSEVGRLPPSNSWQYRSESGYATSADSPYTCQSASFTSPEVSPLPEPSLCLEGSYTSTTTPYVSIAPNLLTSLSYVPLENAPPPESVPSQTPVNPVPNPPSPVSPFNAVASSLAGWNKLPNTSNLPSSASSSQPVGQSAVSYENIDMAGENDFPSNSLQSRGGSYHDLRFELLQQQPVEVSMYEYSSQPLQSVAGPAGTLQTAPPVDFMLDKRGEALQNYAFGLNNLGLDFDYAAAAMTSTSFRSFEYEALSGLDLGELSARNL